MAAHTDLWLPRYCEGMDCLLKSLGVFETEMFISSLLRGLFDYTEWQSEYFADWTLDDFLHKAEEYDQIRHTYTSI